MGASGGGGGGVSCVCVGVWSGLLKKSSIGKSEEDYSILDGPVQIAQLPLL